MSQTITELPAPRLCPVCSVPPHVSYAPKLMAMHRSTALLKTRVSFFIGCVHVERETCNTDERHRNAIKQWNVKAAALFDARTANWTNEQRDRLRAQLDEAQKSA